jgi:hypothetical protein
MWCHCQSDHLDLLARSLYALVGVLGGSGWGVGGLRLGCWGGCCGARAGVLWVGCWGALARVLGVGSGLGLELGCWGALAGVLWMLGGSVETLSLPRDFHCPSPLLVGSVSVADKAGKIVVVSMWFRG